MKPNIRIYSGIFAAAMLLGAGRAQAQQDFTLYNMDALQQSSFLNPATMPKSKVNIYLPVFLPSVGVGVSNSGFEAEKLFRKDIKGVTRIGLSRVLPELAQRNYITTNVQVDLFALGIKLGKNYFSANVSEKVNTRLVYTRDMMELAWNGNGGSLLGRRASFDGTGFYLNHYREYGLSYARELTKKLTVGARAKYLYGMENVYTRKSNFGITTSDETFFLHVDGSADVRSSGLTQEAMDGATGNPGSYLFGRNNHGMAIDLGARYKMLDDKLVLSASVVDLGYIRWNDHIRNFRNDNFEFSFRGLSIFDLVAPKDSNARSASEMMEDSVNKTFTPEQYQTAYSAPLAGRVYLGANWKLSEKMNVGALLYGEMLRGQMMPGLSLSFNTNITRWLQTSVTYSMYNRSYANLGAGIAFNMKAFQIFAMSDNLISAFDIMAVRNVHARFGMNFIFGRPEKEKEPMGCYTF